MPEADTIDTLPKRRGRPPGVQEGRKRRRRKRKAFPADQQYFSINEGADYIGVGRSLICRHLTEIGVIKIGARSILTRERLDRFALSRLR